MELWEEREKLEKLAKTAKEGDNYLGDNGFWKFENGKWRTVWIRIQGRLIKGEEYEKDEQEDLIGYNLDEPKGNY